MTPDSYNPSVEDLRILERFHYRCVRCHRPWSTIHEIDTRGAVGKIAMREDNRVPVCDICHDWIHTVGTENANPELYRCRDEVLANG